MHTSQIVHNIAKYTTFSCSGARNMKCGSFDNRDDGEFHFVGFVHVPEMFVAQDIFLFGTEPFDTVSVLNDDQVEKKGLHYGL